MTYVLTFLAGLVSALGFAPVGAWPLTLFAYVLLLWRVERAPTGRSALAHGWWFGAGQFVLGLNWIATAFTFQAAMPPAVGWVAVVLLSLYLALFPALAAWLAWGQRRHGVIAFVLAFAAAWIVGEWLRAIVFTGFAWNPLAVAFLDSGLAGPARWIGTYGLSGLIVLFAGALFLLARSLRREGALLLGAVAAVALAGWGFAPTPTGASNLPARIVQPNIGQHEKWRPHLALRNLRRLGALSRDARARGPRLLIWPEAAVTEPVLDERRDYQLDTWIVRRATSRMIRPNDLLLTGGLAVLAADRRRPDGATNSIFAIDGAGRIRARYDKAHLVPFGEFLPLRSVLTALGVSRLVPGDLDFRPGPGPRTLAIPGVGPVGFQLCYEIIFSGEVVERGRRPAFLFNPSNDAWFGAWGPPQHLAQARLRALEEGLPVIRATPTGISAVIDADGRLLRALPLGQAGVIDTRLPPVAPPTLFARLGNIASLGFALLLALAAIAVWQKPS